MYLLFVKQHALTLTQWIVGVVPILPGFIAAVNLSISIPDGVTELYYLNYVYGFMASAFAYALLHRLVSDQKLDAFVQENTSAKEVQDLYHGRWDITYAEAGAEIEDPLPDNRKVAASVTASV